jgi:hypothetical protein
VLFCFVLFVFNYFGNYRAMDDETDFAAVMNKGKTFYIGEYVFIGTKSATRTWIARIERFYEDYRGMRVISHALSFLSSNLYYYKEQRSSSPLLLPLLASFLFLYV